MRPPRAAPHEGGFTLVELMVVLVLLGVLLATIIPEMKGTYEDALLRSSGRKLVNAMQLAYSRAVTLNEPHRIRVDPATGRYTVERAGRAGEAGTGSLPVRDVPGGEGQIDARISLEIRRLDDAGATAAEPETFFAWSDERPARSRGEAISFQADGTADAAEIVLRDREGFRLALRVNPTTARVRVVELERE